METDPLSTFKMNMKLQMPFVYRKTASQLVEMASVTTLMISSNVVVFVISQCKTGLLETLIDVFLCIFN